MKKFVYFLFACVLILAFNLPSYAQLKSLKDASKLSKVELQKLKAEIRLKNESSVLSKTPSIQKVYAGVTFFTDRDVFNSTVPGLTLEDFSAADSRLGGDAYWWTGALDKNTNNDIFHTGDIVPGVSIHPSYDWLSSPLNPTPGEYTNENMSALGPAPNYWDYGNPHTIVGTSYFVDKTTIEFMPAVTAASFDIYPYWSGNFDEVTLFDTRGNVIAVDSKAPSSFWGGFFGVISNTPIAKITVHDPIGNDYGDCEFIGNLQFGNIPPLFLSNMEEDWLYYGNRFALKFVTNTTLRC